MFSNNKTAWRQIQRRSKFKVSAMFPALLQTTELEKESITDCMWCLFNSKTFLESNHSVNWIFICNSGVLSNLVSHRWYNLISDVSEDRDSYRQSLSKMTHHWSASQTSTMPSRKCTTSKPSNIFHTLSYIKWMSKYSKAFRAQYKRKLKKV